MEVEITQNETAKITSKRFHCKNSKTTKMETFQRRQKNIFF